jgi:SET domain-containing protein
MSIEMLSDEPRTIEDVEYWRRRPSLAAPALSKRGGRGLFALGPIAAGTIIERACTVEIPQAQTRPLDAMRPLGDYYFAHPENFRAGLMAFGLMSFCNHADPANADMLWSRDEALGWIADLVAAKPIAANEEITYRYRCPLWFSVDQ